MKMKFLSGVQIILPKFVISMSIYYICLCLIDLHLSKSSTSDEDTLRDSISAEQQVRFDDPSLLDHIRTRILEPPSQNVYNLTNKNSTQFFYPSEKFYDRYLKDLFNDTKNGFFIEAGALDGETMSNTIWLEMKQGWTGLLVEPDLDSYRLLKTKQRKSWSANCCLSVEKFPKVETLSYQSFVAETRINGKVMWTRINGMSFMKEAIDSNEIPEEDETFKLVSYNVTCFPLASLLLAMAIKDVDLLSLDVEFVEEKIIKNLNFEKFNIQVIFLECTKTEIAKRLLTFLDDLGYVLLANTASDFVFIKRGTRYELAAKRKNLFREFIEYV